MDSTRRLMIILAVGVIAVFGIIAVRSWLSSEPAPVEEEKTEPKEINIIVAKRDLPLGTYIVPATDMEWMPIPKEQLKDDYLREGGGSIEVFTGSVVRRPLRMGEPVTQGALTRAGEGGFMPAVLEPGMRAVTIAVTPTSGNAGFISPGDRVDLIVTHRIRAATGNPEGSVVSETFVRDVRVVAVDQVLENPENKAILAKTITVEVSPHQAEQIAVASDLGKISFALRSLASERYAVVPEGGKSVDAAETAGEGIAAEMQDEMPLPPRADDGQYTRDRDISRALGETGGAVSTVRVIRGDQVEDVSLR